jgi:PIN domain-containing protein
VRNTFAGWYPRSPEHLSVIWDRAIFVPDTNILLHCLRHSADVREDLLRILETLRHSLWIPYQIGLEFHRHRLEIESAAADGYDRLTKDYETLVSQAREKLKQLRHPSIAIDRELAALDAFLTDFRARMEQAKSQHPAEALAAAVERITALFDGKVGSKPTPATVAAVRKEGEDRYARRVPPGYKDVKKEGPEADRFGDLIIWKELIDKARSEQRPLILISDDAKEDWWHIHRGRKLGPRPELYEEFRLNATQEFHIYDLGQFLRIAAERYQDIAHDRVDAIERSVREDELLRVLVEDERADREQRHRLLALENERDVLISILAGVPGTYASQPAQTIDRAALRDRLAAVDDELASARSPADWKHEVEDR